MKRKIMIAICAVMCAICSVGLFACANAPKTTLIDWESKTIEIGYQTQYTLETSVQDDKGNVYSITASVTTAGNSVPVISGKFTVSEKSDYVIVYTFSNGGDTQTKTVTAKVVAGADPIISLESTLGGAVVLGADFEIPSATAFDYFDGDIASENIEIKVFKVGISEDTEVQFNEADGIFTPTEVGEYYVRYTVSNSNDKTDEERINLSVKEADEYLSVFKPIATDFDDVYNIESDITETFVSAGADEIKDFAGDYTGNAVKMKIAINANYRLKCAYSPQFFKGMAKEYNVLSMWIAVSGIEDTGKEKDGAFMMDNGAEGFNSIQLCATGGTYNLKNNQNKWIKLSAPTSAIADFANGEYLRTFYIWVDENFSGPNACVYVGDIFFESKLIVKNKDMPTPVEMSETEWKADGITGDYTGEAVKFAQDNGNSNFNYYNPYSIAKLNSLKSQYNRISLYFAFNHTDTNGTIWLYHTGFKGKANPANSAYSIAKGNIGVWQKLTISIDDYISLLKEDGTYFYPWGDNEDTSGNLWSPNFAAGSLIDYYFGKLELSYEEPAVLRINESNYTSIANPDAGVSTFISAQTLSTLGIAGDYTGNATRITVKEAALTNIGYRLTTSYTEQQLTELKSKYTHVTTHIAFTGILTGSLNIDTTITDQLLVVSKNNGFANGGFTSTPTWQKVSVTIDQFISLLDNGTVRIIATATWSPITLSSELYMYIGDFVFENIQAQA